MLTIFDGPHVSAALVYEVAQLLSPGDSTLYLRGRTDGDLASLAAVKYSEERDVYLTHSWLARQAATPLNCVNPVPIHHARVLERLALSRRVVRVIVLPREPQGFAASPHLYRNYAAAADYPTRLPTVLSTGGEPAIALAGIINSMRLPANAGPGVGAWRPGKSIMLVGEAPKLKKGRAYLGPFCDWLGGCSPWLSQQLEYAGIPERDLYWVNAYDEHGRPADADFVEALHPAGVVTLGDKAMRWANALHMPASRSYSVPHPQYWKRSQRGRPYPLIDILKQFTQIQEAP